jgi:hypothetical protein
MRTPKQNEKDSKKDETKRQSENTHGRSEKIPPNIAQRSGEMRNKPTYFQANPLKH